MVTKKNNAVADDAVTYHIDPLNKQVVIPQGMQPKELVNTAVRWNEAQETPTSIGEEFPYRPFDGANATYEVLREVYGMVFGHAEQTMFGTRPAPMLSITIGIDDKGKPITKQVPWGDLDIPSREGLQISIGAHMNKDFGMVFHLSAMGPKKYMPEFKEVLDKVRAYLPLHSIYKGKAMLGSEDLEFFDVEKFDRNTIVFSDEVDSIIRNMIEAPIKYAARFQAEGLSLKRTFLLEGPYGTGKTSAGLIIAQTAVRNGWTYISARPGRDDPEAVLRTARLYAPAVVLIEDLDGAASTSEDDKVSRLLEVLDGGSNKTDDTGLIVLFTTNHVERIHKGVLRPGRLDAVVRVAELDRGGVERLVKVTVKQGKLAEGVNYDAVFDAMHGFLPAFVKEAVTRAISYAVSRAGGSPDYLIDTVDLVGSAHSLQDHLDLLNGAGEGERVPTLDAALRGAVSESVTGVGVVREGQDEPWARLYPAAITE